MRIDRLICLFVLALVLALAVTPIHPIAAGFDLVRIFGTSSTGTPVPLVAVDGNLQACDSHVAISGNSIATAALAAPVSGKRVALCAVTFVGAGATTVKLVRGTGATCGTGTTDVTGVMTLATGTPVTLGDGAAILARTSASEGLCWTNSAAVQVSGVATYAQY